MYIVINTIFFLWQSKSNTENKILGILFIFIAIETDETDHYQVFITKCNGG